MRSFDASGIRKVFDLAAKMTDPINLSIGQPDFDVASDVQQAAVEAIHRRHNGYSPTQGVPDLQAQLQARVDAEFGHRDRRLFVTSGTSGALTLALLALINPGDEVILFDPYFVSYEALVNVVGGKTVYVDTYPSLRVDPDQVAAAISPRTKAILFNSPANPTGMVATRDEIEGLARLAARHGVALISDEIYREFCFDEPFVSPAEFNAETIVIDGFSKSHAMTGWRVGFAHGPGVVIEEMAKLQQYTFVCAPQPFQWAALHALTVDMSDSIATYAGKRDRIVQGLADDFELVTPGGAFYAFPRAPRGTGVEFVERAIQAGLLIIPGNIFSQRDTHFRLSYAASDETIDRGIEVLQRLARE